MIKRKAKVSIKKKVKIEVKNNRKNPAKWYSKDRLLHNKEVIGVTGDMMDIDYFGLISLIKPLDFFKLVDLSNLEYLKDKNYYYILDWMNKKKPVGHPYLRISIPNEWFRDKYAAQGFIKSNEPPRIIGHEGRHRTLSSYMLYGNDPIEVFLFFNGEKGQGIRNEHLDGNFKYNLLHNEIYSEFNKQIVVNSIKKLL